MFYICNLRVNDLQELEIARLDLASITGSTLYNSSQMQKYNIIPSYFRSSIHILKSKHKRILFRREREPKKIEKINSKEILS